MASSLYSPSWYRIAPLKPRLKPHVRLHRQRFRGQTWHIVQDDQSGHFHRLSPAAHHMVCLMDGRRSIAEIWTILCQRLGKEQPTQDEVIRLMSLLHAADLTLGDALPDMAEMSVRSDRTARQLLLSRVKNPLSIRFSLLDPDRFLDRTMPFFAPLFSRAGFACWLLLIAAFALNVATHWPALNESVSDRLLSTQNVLLILIIFPVMKLLHELGHAYATKKWGGEVHELGVMLLVFVPIPYVDASASAAFRSKWRRAIVGAAGMMVELLLAAIASFVWIHAEPGLIRAAAFNVMLLGGISTILVNGNFLLRFDGYYILCDLIEIPNLASRANKYVIHLTKRHLLRVDDLETPVTARGERAWFIGYAIFAFVYRLTVTVGIAFFVASHFFVVGVFLALLSLATTLVWPLLKACRYLAADAQLAGKRRSAIGVSLGLALLAAGGLLVVPLPYATMAQGVVWVADEATIRVQTEGFARMPAIPEDRQVKPGSLLAELEDPLLDSGIAIARSQLDELTVRLEAAGIGDRVLASILREEIKNTEAQLRNLLKKRGDLSIVSGRSGRFQTIEAADLHGRFFRKGDVIGYVLGDDDPIVRVIVPQSDVDPVRRGATAIQARLATDAASSLTASVVREVPAAVQELPHAALATIGGGDLLLDPRHQDRLQPLDPVFQLDLAVPGLPKASRLGTRVHVRFEHAPQPLGQRIGRWTRQLFLKQFNV